MKAKIASKMGEIQISSDVIATYAGTTAVGCFGIVGMAKLSMREGGIARLLRDERLRKGITVNIVNNEIDLDFHVIVAYGVSIQAVCGNLTESVRYKLEEFTGMKVNRVSVYVEGVRLID